MATIAKDTLKTRYDALQAERARSWSAEQVARNADQRRTLVERFDPAAVAQPGTVLPAIGLESVEGGALTLDALTANGPALLLFFRFAGCPACNIALSYYAQALWPALRQRHIPLVAISPQRSDWLVEIKRRHDLPFDVLTDDDNGLARALGIAFQPDDRPTPPPPGWIGEVTGTNSWKLPQPTLVLLDPGRVIRWMQVSPDWLDRPEAEEIIARLD